MFRVICIILLVVSALFAERENKRDKPFNHEIGIEVSTIFQAEYWAWGPIPNAGIVYRYYFTNDNPIEPLIGGGIEQRIYGRSEIALYADAGIRLNTKHKRWDPLFYLRTAFRFGLWDYDDREAFSGVDFIVNTDLVSFQTKKGNSISFLNPRLIIGIHNESSSNRPYASLAASIFKYAVRF